MRIEENEINDCLKDFLELYQKKEFISTKEMDSYIDKYQYIFHNILSLEQNEKNEKIKQIANHIGGMIKNHNDKFIEAELVRLKEYFDQMFLEVDEAILLDEEQRRAILIEEDYTLIIAGAGSGKTTTMAAKAKYLVEQKHINPKDILLLSFTNKAVSELDKVVNDSFHLGIEIQTFHKLGRNLLNEYVDSPLKISGDREGYNFIVNYLKKVVFERKEKLEEYMKYFVSELHFDLECFQYQTFTGYFEAYKKKVYASQKDNLREYIENRVATRLENLRTINGENMKSKGEVRIANFLYENSLLYDYEALYKYKTQSNSSYVPDFTIYPLDKEIYIEYYGLTTYSENGEFTVEEIEEYNYIIEKKRALHQKYGTDLIELYSSYERGEDPITVLTKELAKRGIPLVKRSDKEILNRILDTSMDYLYIKFVRLMLVFIHTWKERLYQKEDFETILESLEEERLKGQLKIAKEIYEVYQAELKDSLAVDFADMINLTEEHLSQIKEKCIYLNYKYIIVDEYQDISISRYKLLKKLSDLFDSKIVAVGDDWQSIFEFSGSDMELFTKFREILGYGEVISIENTYRNSQELINIAGSFIGKNSLQYQKILKSNKHIENPIQIVYYENLETMPTTLEKVLDTFSEDKHILLLGRFVTDIEFVLGIHLIRKNKTKIVYTKNPNLQIDFLTIHKSKGLGYDNVILLNLLNGVYGLPSKRKDHPLIALLKKETEEKRIIEYPEERRLFYVAMTRAKEKVYLMTPISMRDTSEFIKELKRDYDIVENKIFLEESELV